MLDLAERHARVRVREMAPSPETVPAQALYAPRGAAHRRPGVSTALERQRGLTRAQGRAVGRRKRRLISHGLASVNKLPWAAASAIRRRAIAQ